MVLMRVKLFRGYVTTETLGGVAAPAIRRTVVDSRTLLRDRVAVNALLLVLIIPCHVN